MTYQSFQWLIFIPLFVLGLISLFLAFPLSTKPVRWIISIALVSAFIGLGLVLATSDGIEVSLLANRVSGLIGDSQLIRGIGWALVVGVAVGIFLLVMLYIISRQLLPQLRARFKEEIKFPIWRRLVTAIYSGILEEIIFRLFLLSLLAWLVGLFWHTAAARPAPGALWVSNIIAAIVFGLVHLPRWSSLTRLTPALILALLTLNGLGGLVFGYLFITHGIEAAIIAHFMGDTVLHLIGPNILST